MEKILQGKRRKVKNRSIYNNQLLKNKVRFFTGMTMISLSSSDTKKLLKYIIAFSIIGVIVFFIVIFSILGITINMQFYENRLQLNWWDYFTLENSAILWCPLITIVILVILVTCLNPFTSSTLNLLYGIIVKTRRPSKVNSLIWNYAVIAGAGGFVMGLIIGFTFNTGFGIFVANYANLSYEFFSTVFAALNYPLNPGTLDVNVLFTYSFILRPFILLVVGGLIIRLFLNLINPFNLRSGGGLIPFKVTGSIGLIISLFFFIAWLYLPNGAYDIVDSQAVWAVILGFYGSLIVGAFFYILGVINPARYRGRQFYRTFIAMALIIIFIFPIGALIASGVQGLYREANWNQWVWDTKIQTEIATTRTAAGLDNFTQLTTQQLLTNQTAPDTDIIGHVRTYDYQAARLSMENQIGTSWEELADSDIHYLNRMEYWIAPRKIRSQSDYGFNLDWVQEHIIYTHSRGFIALNTVTGTLIPKNAYETTFGVPYNYSIYFGELPDNKYTILNVTQFEEIENNTYQGAPDISLDGLLNWFYIEDWGFKTTDLTDYLIKRNVYDRVGGILLPFMTTGDDVYLVFDKSSKKMYYCVDIILSFPSFSGYMQSRIVRWLGVVLIDTMVGTMNFYKYDYANLPYGFLNVYMDRYNWQSMPSWLLPQLKYPASLIDAQLEIDYTFHVQDAVTWRSGEDFFERPQGSEFYQIIYDVGYGTTYVGASIVEFRQASVGNLVGFYIVEGGEVPIYLGRTTFYRNGTAGQTQMIGLSAAKSAYQQKDAQFLQLLVNYRFGNYLIYPFADSLYYVLPIYESSGYHIETLKRVALVNAFNPGKIGIGNSTMQAYNALNITTIIPAGVLSLNILSAPAISKANSYDPILSNLNLLINNGNPNQEFNTTLRIKTQSTLFNVSYAGAEITPTFDGQNYSYFIADLNLLPTQSIGLAPQITGRLSGGASTTISYNVQLFFQNGTLFDSKQKTLFVYL